MYEEPSGIVGNLDGILTVAQIDGSEDTEVEPRQVEIQRKGGSVGTFLYSVRN